jgi:membrane-bound lytic murein transglycosylase MltF
MILSEKQKEVKERITLMAEAMDLDPILAIAVAMTESSLGVNQKSPTGCKGVFQLSSIAMKDLLLEMEKADDDIIDIACGLAFIHLLLKRHKTIEKAIAHFCDPADIDFYIERVRNFMGEFDVQR